MKRSLVVSLLALTGCSQANTLDACLRDASNRPTNAGVIVAQQQCEQADRARRGASVQPMPDTVSAPGPAPAPSPPRPAPSE